MKGDIKVIYKGKVIGTMESLPTEIVADHLNQVIVINGKQVQFRRSHILYEEVLSLAGFALVDGYSMVYTRVNRGYKGTLMKGQSVTVTDGMRFNVDLTGNA